MAELTEPANSPLPDLAVVVLSVGAPAELVAAVKSVIAQGQPTELVVVNSGGGDARGLLVGEGIDVPVLERQERLFVGAARNIGIANTTARWIAFLAADCLAAPGWASERLRLHRDGAAMVASAVMPDRPDSLVCWADHLLRFARRLPGLPAADALLYGVSFDRRVFERIGLFDGSLATGEDTELLARAAHFGKPVWAPTVVLVHRNARSVGGLLRDQAVRGRAYAVAMRRLRKLSPFKLLEEPVRQPRHAWRVAKRFLAGREREVALSSLWLVRIGCVARALGILSALLPIRPRTP
ncbi:MAG: glycosyltransferase family A protein [Bauldia sp.]|mgnify:CR=1 FL=1